MILDPEDLGPRETYKFLTASVVPRPIAWVSTVSADGVNNLAPFSFYTVASRDPATLVISVGERTDDQAPEKDTLRNIEDTREFVVNVVSVSLANAMHESSLNHAPEADEFRAAGLSAAKSELVAAPRISEARISTECRLDGIIPIGSDHLVLGRAVRFHILDDLYKSGRVDLEALDPLGRLAGNYTKLGGIFNLPM
ncbi:flavin reductase family protein [Rubrobacter indicoceani]|uniref:flavin reductase family protein n=1 Tax=Rubrobacter indicoceani TaxID=2051957 RepID=UPI000E5BB8EA|nr:flavin reductase family protein [Rubrobacter indicoceani]